jgi:hypothetical protein
MSTDPNYNYIIAAYSVAFILLALLTVKVFFSYRKHKSINTGLEKAEPKK